MDYEVKADALEDSFDAVEMKPERPVLVAEAPAYLTAFDGFVRRGETGGVKSFSGATGSEGGFAVPREIDSVIDATLKSISPIRRIANVVRVGTAGYRKLVTQNGVASGWATEVAARPETATPTFNEIVPPMGDLYANPAASQFMLDDAAFDVEAWLSNEIATEFARAEGAAFVGGSGTARPKGFLTFPTATTSDATRPFGTLQYLASGAAGAFTASNPQDRLVDLVQALRAPYRQGASWVMNSKTLATLRKFKTTDGAFLWQPSLIVGNADTLLGYPDAAQHYLSGFVLAAQDRAQWALIDAAAERARDRGVAATYVWALPQVMRDGFVHFDLGEEPVDAFDDVAFPLSMGREAVVSPGFSTAVVTTASGHEQRNADWASARMRYDVGPGVRSEADVATLISFFRARRGAAKGFRFRDPTNFLSNGMTGTPGASDVLLGVGDGVRTGFDLFKVYGVGIDAEVRPVSRPVPASVLVSVGGVAVASGWSLVGGRIVFAVAPLAGAEVRAGFLFDVPVRFASDVLEVSVATWRAGEVVSVGLVEVRG